MVPDWYQGGKGVQTTILSIANAYRAWPCACLTGVLTLERVLDRIRRLNKGFRVFFGTAGNSARFLLSQEYEAGHIF